jgi:hypothetical protein
MKTKFVLVLFLFATMSGCAFWDGFQRGITGEDPVAAASIEVAGEAAGYAVVDSVGFFPSPWREILIALLSGVTGWSAATRKGKEK